MRTLNKSELRDLAEFFRLLDPWDKEQRHPTRKAEDPKEESHEKADSRGGADGNGPGK